MEELRQALQVRVDGVDRWLRDPTRAIDTRELTNAALGKLNLGRDAAEAEAMFRLVFDLQKADGSLPWQYRGVAQDSNATAFATQAIGPALLLYGDRLSDAFRAYMRPHLRAALTYLGQHNGNVTYTNIFLMQAVDTILMAEWLGDSPAQVNRGYNDLDRWIRDTRQGGIHEYNSLTYDAVDLSNLVMGYLLAQRPGARATFQGILDYFWADIAANYFPGHSNLAGPHSRDYDWVYGQGIGDAYLYAESLSNLPRTSLEASYQVYLLEGLVDQGYHPGDDILALGCWTDRVVKQRWDNNPVHDRYNYVTDDFALGYANGDYGSQDKLINVELAAPTDHPLLSVVPDKYDSPYGKATQMQRSGLSKPYHPALHPTIVQERGAMLALLEVNASQEGAFPSLATNVILPFNADALTFNGTPVDPEVLQSEDFALRGDPQTVIGVREGTGAVAIRLFHADPTNDGVDGVRRASFTLQGDQDGRGNHAVRYSAYHYRSRDGQPHTQPNVHVKVGVLILAAHVETDDDFAALLDQAARASITEQFVASQSWEVQVGLGGLTLAAARDLSRGQTMYRRVNGHDVQTDKFTVNGIDLTGYLP